MNFDWLLYCAITDSCYAVTVQLENNCTATNGTIYTGYAIIMGNSINDVMDKSCKQRLITKEHIAMCANFGFILRC